MTGPMWLASDDVCDGELTAVISSASSPASTAESRVLLKAVLQDKAGGTIEVQHAIDGEERDSNPHVLAR